MSGQLDSHSALLCIDLQKLGCTSEHCTLEHHGAVRSPDHAVERFISALENTVIPNVQRLQAHFRAAGCEVIHTRICSLTADGRDRSREHKRLGIHAPPGSELAEFLDEVAPADDEIVLNKTASGVFVSTNIEYVLRNLDVRRLYICGVYTNECVSSAVRSASDLGFDVVLIDDATAAITAELHEATMLIVDGRYGAVKSTADILTASS